jgi:glyoxylase-like metal-dependent hydrolase (beta-lactamase superfamily II)
MAKAFASSADLADKRITCTEMAPGCFSYTAEGDPNSGFIVGESSVVVVDTQPTPVMAQDVLARIRKVTDKPITHVILTHYHAVRVLGASAYGAHTIVASSGTRELIEERGAADMDSEISRFPRLFRGRESIPGLTRPNLVFTDEVSLYLGSLEVRVIQFGRGHTKGDSIVWVPKYKVLYSGDLVEFGATPYTGDAYLKDWPETLDRLAKLGAEKLVPGRGDALLDAGSCRQAIADTRAFVSDLLAHVEKRKAAGADLKSAYRETYDLLRAKYGHWKIFDHCLPFNVSRAYDEAGGVREPRVWTDARDREMWSQLEG